VAKILGGGNNGSLFRRNHGGITVLRWGTITQQCCERSEKKNFFGLAEIK